MAAAVRLQSQEQRGCSPKVILVTTSGASEQMGVTARPDACISIDCAERELLAMVEQLAARRVDAPRGGLAPGALRRVTEHIESRLAHRIDVDDMAEIAGLSPCHFGRAFKQSLGVPPHRYVMERRIEAAARLIRDSGRKLAEIALDVGFCDQSHFTRLFASHHGVTPLAFRRLNR
jgi:AraC-like DNA-binding protein